jgi:colanic acid/amylovoran biosynthesis protein
LVRVLITNTHSALNSGDLAITLAEVQLIKRHRAVEAVTLTSRTPGIDREFLEPLGGRLLPPLVPAPSVFDGAPAKAIRTVKECVAVRSKAALIKEMKRCDLVIGSGGGYFWSNRRRLPGPMFLQNYLHLLIPCLLRKPVILFPQSFGPFFNTTVARFIRELLNREEVVRVFVREEISRDVVHELVEQENRHKIDICPDVAFCLDRTAVREPLARLRLPKPIVGVTVRQWDFPDHPARTEKIHKQAEYLRAVADACLKIHREWHASIMVFAQARGPGAFEDDSGISDELVQLLKQSMPAERVARITLPRAVHPTELLRLLSTVDLLIATRFHSAIFAFLAEIPAISIAYQPKSTGIMSSLGFDRYSLDIAAVDPATISELAGEILEQHEDITATVARRMERVRTTAMGKLKSALESITAE